MSISALDFQPREYKIDFWQNINKFNEKILKCYRWILQTLSHRGILKQTQFSFTIKRRTCEVYL